MPIDRLIHTDPNLGRVSGVSDQPNKRRQQEYQQEKEKDKFEKKPSVWKKILSFDGGKRKRTSLLGEKPKRLTLPTQKTFDEEPSERDEGSFTFTERILVLWGMIGKDGRPRPGVILTYVLILGMFVGALFLVIGMILWQ
ncbi:MAG: hypothetical protein HY542_01860 [Deltaproteobacteria bacterium]|nr:hypothetical protein [Deltaproteobacteria bacterium]